MICAQWEHVPKEQWPAYVGNGDVFTPKGKTQVVAGKQEDHEAGLRFVLQRAVELIRQRFGGTDKTILLVGHGNSGRALLRLLTQNKLADNPPMTNTGIWMVEEQPNGQFKMEMYNDARYEISGKTS